MHSNLHNVNTARVITHEAYEVQPRPYVALTVTDVNGNYVVLFIEDVKAAFELVSTAAQAADFLLKADAEREARESKARHDDLEGA